jgi:hypothetical protein
MRIPKLSVPVIIAILSVALAVGAVVYAFTTVQESRDTGAISVGTEATAIELITYQWDGATATPVLDGSWCEAGDLQPGNATFCLVSVKNLKTSSEVIISQTTSDVDNADSQDLAGSLLVSLGDSAASASGACDKAEAMNGVYENETLASLPGFGDPTPGVQVGVDQAFQNFPAGLLVWYCFHVAHDPLTPVYDATTSATITFHADDDLP